MTEQLKDRPGDQPLPCTGQQAVMDQVIAKVRARGLVGMERYGSALMTFNGRNSLRDAIEEAVDLTAYLTQMEMEGVRGRRAVFTQVSAYLRRYAFGTQKVRDEMDAGGFPVVTVEDASRIADLVDRMAEKEEGPQDPDDFFVMGCTYVHPAEGVFLVKYVGRPPAGFEYPSEVLGVAFGWRRDACESAVGATHGWLPPNGEYTTSDFAGWELQR
ncbi:hypothetical protein ACFZAM_32040 [Streptomyces sp. NPDC008079]|uniref:hypothetical protein n=1 Tax=Streptomyces sp. NPDC008079 TaxID=3364806 RepID=UPI0036E62589